MWCCFCSNSVLEETDYIPTLSRQERKIRPRESYYLNRVALQIIALFTQFKDHFLNADEILKTTERYKLTIQANILMHILLMQDAKMRKLALRTVKKKYGADHFKFFGKWNDRPIFVIKALFRKP